MSEAVHEVADSREDLDLVSSNEDRPLFDHHVTSLRGPVAAGVGRSSWLIVGVLGMVIFAAIIVVSFVSATRVNSTIERMKAHGIPVSVTVVACIGNIGGSGSNSAGYTCHGSYHVGGTSFHETIGSMSTFAATGTSVSAIADPLRHSTVVLASSIRSSTPSPTVYVPSSLLSVLFGALLLFFRRPANRHETPSTPIASTERPQIR